MDKELTVDDWKQIAGYYQQKFNELELKVLALELENAKSQDTDAPSAPVANKDD